MPPPPLTRDPTPEPPTFALLGPPGRPLREMWSALAVSLSYFTGLFTRIFGGPRWLARGAFISAAVFYAYWALTELRRKRAARQSESTE